MPPRASGRSRPGSRPRADRPAPAPDHSLRMAGRFVVPGASSELTAPKRGATDSQGGAMSDELRGHYGANDDDVEGHGHFGANDEGDEVEGHGHYGANDEQRGHFGENDEVEGHGHFGANDEQRGHYGANDEDDEVEGHAKFG